MAVPPDATDAFAVSVEHHDGHDLVEVSGDLDVYTCNELRDLVADPRLWRQPLLLLDLAQVAFLDSTGLSALVATRRLAKARDAELRVVCPSGSALRVIRMTRLDQVLSVFPSRDEALSGAVAPGPA